MKYLLLLPFLLLAGSASAIPVCPLDQLSCPPEPEPEPDPTPSLQFKSFTKPVIPGGRLDWCLTWATDCGRPAANEYCESKGYDRSTSFSIDNDIGYTKLITGAICSAPHCDGFLKITCVKTLW